MHELAAHRLACRSRKKRRSTRSRPLLPMAAANCLRRRCQHPTVTTTVGLATLHPPHPSAALDADEAMGPGMGAAPDGVQTGMAAAQSGTADHHLRHSSRPRRHPTHPHRLRRDATAAKTAAGRLMQVVAAAAQSGWAMDLHPSEDHRDRGGAQESEGSCCRHRHGRLIRQEGIPPWRHRQGRWRQRHDATVVAPMVVPHLSPCCSQSRLPSQRTLLEVSPTAMAAGRWQGRPTSLPVVAVAVGVAEVGDRSWRRPARCHRVVERGEWHHTVARRGLQRHQPPPTRPRQPRTKIRLACRWRAGTLRREKRRVVDQLASTATPTSPPPMARQVDRAPTVNQSARHTAVVQQTSLKRLVLQSGPAPEPGRPLQQIGRAHV